MLFVYYLCNVYLLISFFNNIYLYCILIYIIIYVHYLFIYYSYYLFT